MANTLAIEKIFFKYKITLNDIYEYKNININQISFDESIFKFQPIQSMNLTFPNFEMDNPNNFVYNLTNNLPIECDIDISITQNENISGKYYIYDIHIKTLENNKYINMTLDMIHENQIKTIVQMNRQYSYDTNVYTTYTDIFKNYFKTQNINIDTLYLPDFNNKLVEDSKIVFPKGVNILNIIGQLKSKLSSSEYNIPLLFTTLKKILYFTNIVKLTENPIDSDIITQIIGKSMQDEQYNMFYDKTKSILYLFNEEITSNIGALRYNNMFMKTFQNIQTESKNKLVLAPSYYKSIDDLNVPTIADMNKIADNDLYLHLLQEMDYMAKNTSYYYLKNKNLINQNNIVIAIPNPYMSTQFNQGRIVNVKTEKNKTLKNLIGTYIIGRTIYNIDFKNRLFDGILYLYQIE